MNKLKHLILLPIFTLISLSVLGCSNIKEIEGNLIFSELFNGNGTYDSAIEVTSLKDNLHIKNYKIEFYRYKDLTYTYTFDDVILNQGESFVIYNKDFSKKNELNFENKIELDGNYVTNSFYTRLLDENSSNIDSLNYNLRLNESIKNCSLVRLNEYFKGRKDYRALDFIRVKNDTTKYLGNSNAPITLEELLEGPKIDSELYGEVPFAINGNPTGGYCNVKLASLGDGDTTQFTFPEGQGVENGYKHRCRYIFIDTPEIKHGNIEQDQPYGREAQRFNNDKLRNAKGIICQSNKDGRLTGDYDRTLAFVYYTDVLNGSLETYKMLNFELLLNGLAQYQERGFNEKMYYKDILYNYFLEYATKLAEEKKLNLFSDKNI